MAAHTRDDGELIAALVAALKDTERLCQALCTVAMHPKVDDYMPYGLLDDVKAHLASSAVSDAIAKAEGR
jgi:hypothetical protein